MALSHSARQSFWVFSGTLTSRLLGFVRVVLIGTTLGFTRLSDSYSLANETPNMMYELILGSLIASTMVPFFVQQYKRRDRDADNALMSFVFFASIGLTAVTLILTPFIAHFMTALNTSSNANAQKNLVIFFLLFFLPQIFFYAMTSAMQAYLAARARFVAAAFAPIINNVVVIAALLYIRTRSSELHVGLAKLRSLPIVHLLAITTTLGVVLIAAILAGVYIQAGGRLKIVSWRNKHIRALMSRSKWMVAYAVANQLALFVVIALANKYSGGVVMYLVAWSFFQLPHGLIANSVSTTMIPRITHMLHESSDEERTIHVSTDAAKITQQTATGLTIMMSIVSALGIAVAVPALVVLIGHGSLSANQGAHTGRVLIGFLAFLPAFSLYLFIVGLANSLNKTKVIFYINVLQNSLNLIFVLAFRHAFTIVGLSVAFSLSYLVVVPLSILVTNKEIKTALLARRTTATMVLACAVGAASGFYVSTHIDNRYLAIIAGAAICAFIQLIGAFFSRDALGDLARLVYRRGPRDAPV